MPNKYPKEHYKPHSAKPYERPKGIFRRIASTLHDMFIPSWLLYEASCETQSSTNHLIETSVESQQKRNRTDLNETYADTQYAASEESCSYSCIAEDKKIGRSKNYHSTDKHTSEINPNKSSIPLHSEILQDNYILQEKSAVQHEHIINGDDNSENSEGSASTSGCSSLVSSHQERRDPVRDTGLQLSESALEQIKKELAEKQLLRRIEKKDKSVETDSINHDIDRNYKRKQMPRMYKDNVPPSKRARPQPAVVSQRPTFSLLNFGAPLLKDSSHSVNKCCHSPFYEGKTMFGGASSLRRQQIVLSTPYQNVKFQNVRLKVKEPSIKNEFDYMSTTAKRILHSLEKTSPAIPATLRLRGPPVVGIIPTSQSIIEKNLEPRLSSTEHTQKETFPVAISKCPNVQSSSPSNTSVISNCKMRGQVHLSPSHSQKLDSDKVSDNVKIPNVVLPVSKSPFFNFTQCTSENSTTITTEGNGNSFTFASPIQYNAPSQIHNSEMHFTFSSPVNKDKETDPVSNTVSQSEETEASKKECSLSVKSPSHVSKELSDLKVSSEKIAEIQKKQNNEIKNVQGFGEKFKPEIGSWECSVCLVRNKESNDKCVSCETPNSRISLASTSQASNFEGFGDKFKKPAGSWSCPTCMIVNNESVLSCEACQTPKPQCSHAKETEKLNTTNMSFGNKYKPPSGSWECDTCFVQNSDDVSKCVACETSRPYHTEVADPKQMFTGFKFGVPEKSDTTFKFGTSPVVTTSVVGTSSGFQFGTNAVTTVESGFKFGITPIVTNTSGTSEFKFNETSSSTATTTGFKFGDTPTSATNTVGTGGFKFGVSPFNVSSTPVTTAGGFQFGIPSSNVTTTSVSTTGGFQFVMSPSSAPTTSVTTANGFQFGIPSSVTAAFVSTSGFQFEASPSSVPSTSVTTVAGGFQFGVPSSNVTTTLNTTGGFQFAMSPPTASSTSVTTADGLQFGVSSSVVPSTSVTTVGESQSEGSASSISVTSTGFKFGEAPSTITNTTGISGFQFPVSPSSTTSGTATKLEAKTPEVKTSPSIKFGTPVSSIQSFGEIPPASTGTTSSIFGGKPDKNLTFTTNGQVELGISPKINTANPSSISNIFGQSPTIPVTKDEPNNFKFGFKSTGISPESKKPNDKKIEMPGFLISTTTAIVQPSASLVPPTSVISTSCTTPVFTFGKPQPVSTTTSETFLQNKTKGEGSILSKPNTGDFQFNFSTPQKSSNVTKPLFGLSQNPGSVEAVPSKMGSKFGSPTTVGISPASTTALFTFGSGALGSSSGISNNFAIPSSSTFSFGSSKPIITTAHDPAIHSTCSNTFSSGTSAPQVSFSNFGSKLSTPVFGQNINQPKEGGFGFQPPQNLQFNAATSSNVFRFGMPPEQKPGDDVKSGFSFNTSQDQEQKTSSIQAQKSSFNFTSNNETAKSKPAINFFTPKTTPVFGMPSTSTVVGTTPTFNFTGNASSPSSATPFSFTATPSSASSSPVQRKIKRAVRRSGVGGRRD